MGTKIHITSDEPDRLTIERYDDTPYASLPLRWIIDTFGTILEARSVTLTLRTGPIKGSEASAILGRITSVTRLRLTNEAGDVDLFEYLAQPIVLDGVSGWLFPRLVELELPSTNSSLSLVSMVETRVGMSGDTPSRIELSARIRRIRIDVLSGAQLSFLQRKLVAGVLEVGECSSGDGIVWPELG